jgi:hypothetical protein
MNSDRAIPGTCLAAGRHNVLKGTTKRVLPMNLVFGNRLLRSQIASSNYRPGSQSWQGFPYDVVTHPVANLLIQNTTQMKRKSPARLVPSVIESKIHEVRGSKVMLDMDLAELYGVETKRLKEAVRRNRNRFPADFMFVLKPAELEDLRSQIASSNKGGVRYMPYAFTEQGVAMLSAVLNSRKAVQVNIQIIRAFVLLRQHALSHKDLTQKLHQLEARYDQQFKDVYDAINFLLRKDEQSRQQNNRRKIGYRDLAEPSAGYLGSRKRIATKLRH